MNKLTKAMNNSNQNRGNNILQIIILLLLIIVSIFVFVDKRDSGEKKPEEEESIYQEPPRDCRQEYDQLLQEKYNSIKDAGEAARRFLKDFDFEEQCSECCDEIRKMEAEFVNMESLFNNVDNDIPEDRYCSFISMVKANDNVFSGSSYEAVRKTWEYLKDEKKYYYLRERLNLIEESDIMPYLVDFAIDLAKARYDKWDVVGRECYILNDRLEEFSIVEGLFAKRGVCIVHVAMKGAKWYNRNRIGYVEYQVEGTLNILTSCDVSFSRGSHKLICEEN